jgi:hypothetical protein
VEAGRFLSGLRSALELHACCALASTRPTRPSSPCALPPALMRSRMAWLLGVTGRPAAWAASAAWPLAAAHSHMHGTGHREVAAWAPAHCWHVRRAGASVASADAHGAMHACMHGSCGARAARMHAWLHLQMCRATHLLAAAAGPCGAVQGGAALQQLPCARAACVLCALASPRPTRPSSPSALPPALWPATSALDLGVSASPAAWAARAAWPLAAAHSHMHGTGHGTARCMGAGALLARAPRGGVRCIR